MVLRLHFLVILFIVLVVYTMISLTGITVSDAIGSKTIIELPPIVKEGSSSLKPFTYPDFILPLERQSFQKPNSFGQITTQLEKRLNVPMSDTGQGHIQLRGLSGFSDSVDTQTLGIPLNSLQGGGFNLATFPKSFWSYYDFQNTLPRHALGSTGFLGQLTLTPKSAEDIFPLRQKERQAKDQNFDFFRYESQAIYSSIGTYEVNAASLSRSLGFFLGYRDGQNKGPFGNLSLKWHLTSKHQGYLHLLAGDTVSKSLGPISSPTPHAKLRVLRWIPVLQNHFPLTSKVLLDTKAFFDSERNFYSDPDRPDSFCYSHGRNWGAQAIVKWPGWSVSLGVKSSIFNSNHLSKTLSQNHLALELTSLQSWSDMSFEPELQLQWTSNDGAYPKGGLGIRWIQTPNHDLFLKGTWSPRVPTLLDRYYELPSFKPNPHLETEWITTLILGNRWSLKKDIELRTEVNYQKRDQPTLLWNEGPINAEVAHVLSLQQYTSLRIHRWLGIEQSIRFTRSWLKGPLSELPLLPSFFGALTAELGPRKSAWTGFATLRVASEQKSPLPFAKALKGYRVFDLALSWQLGQTWQAHAHIENLFDDRYERYPGYPLGREFGIHVRASL